MLLNNFADHMCSQEPMTYGHGLLVQYCSFKFKIDPIPERCSVNERMQTILVGFVISNKERIFFGVSQGSGLEPSISLIYINDTYCSASANKFNFYSYVMRSVRLFRRV